MRALFMLLLVAVLFVQGDQQLQPLNVSVSPVCRDGTLYQEVSVSSQYGAPINGAVVIVDELEGGDPVRRVATGNTEEGKFEFQGCEKSYRVRVSKGGYETALLSFQAGDCACVSPPPQESGGGESPPQEQPSEQPSEEQPSESPPQDSSPTEDQPPAEQPEGPSPAPSPLPDQTEVPVELPEPPQQNSALCCLPTAMILLLASLFIKKSRK